MKSLFYPLVEIRLILYAILGLVSEVLFTAIMDLIAPKFLQSWHAKSLVQSEGSQENEIARDSKAMGYTFLWMIPIYMLLVFIEPVSQLLLTWPWFLRGLVYLIFFWIAEYITGALIKKITGYCPWDYSYSRFSVHGYIRWDYAPVWFSFSLFVEWISAKFILLAPAIKEIFFG